MERNNLYFIPLLAEAFDDKHPAQAMRDAIRKIITLGKLEEYAKEYKQFEEFIEVGFKRDSEEDENILKIDTADVLRNKLVKAKHSQDENRDLNELLKKIKINKNLYEEFKDLIHNLENGTIYEFELYKNQNIVASKSLKKNGFAIKFTNVEIGEYAIKLSNSRELWSGSLTEQDLIWEKAFPEKDYSMAAATRGEEGAPSKSFKVLDDEILVEVYPGFESGTIQIKII